MRLSEDATLRLSCILVQYTYIYVRDGLHKQYTVLYNHKYCPLSRLFILPGQLAKVEEREQGE